jgi:hypothetical protein
MEDGRGKGEGKQDVLCAVTWLSPLFPRASAGRQLTVTEISCGKYRTEEITGVAGSYLCDVTERKTKSRNNAAKHLVFHCVAEWKRVLVT